MRFIHIADLHLGSSPEAEFAWGKDRAEELWDSLAAVLDACNEKKIDLLLIAGDLFDRPPVWADLDRVSNMFSMLETTQVVIIAGAADYIENDSPWLTYPWKPWVHVLTDRHCISVHLDEINTSVSGCSYHASSEPRPYLEDALVDNENEYQILLGYSNGEEYMPADFAQLAEKGFDYIALGSEHKPRLLADKRIAYAGSLEPLSESESGKHGLILGEISKDGTAVKFIPFACREYINIKVRMSSDTKQDTLEEKLAKAMEQYGSENIFSFSLEGRYKPGMPYDRERLMALGNVCGIKDDTMPDYNIVALLEEHKDDMIGMYLEEFLKETAGTREQKAMYYGLEALLNAAHKTK